jgi:hypothetical protein
MNRPYPIIPPLSRMTLTLLLCATLPVAACDRSNSVGKLGGSTAAAGRAGTGEGTGAGAESAGTAAGGNIIVGGGTSSGGKSVTASGGAAIGGSGGSGGKSSVGGGGAQDAAVDRVPCPVVDHICPQGSTTDVNGCTICAAGGTGGGGSGGTTVMGGASGSTRVDAAVDARECPPLTDVYCTGYITDANGCVVCTSTGTGGVSGGTSGKGGSGGTTGAAGSSGGAGTTGTAGSSGSGGTTGKTCRRLPERDSVCRALNLPPLSYFCGVPALPTSTACVAYNGIDSGDEYCCPEPYLTCPDSPPTNASACTGSMTCTYGSHPDPTCRTSAICSNSTWQVTAPPSRCSDPQLPATCPASPVSGTACSSHGLNCYYNNGSFCSCTNCTVEDNLCNSSTSDTWRCWTPPGSDCPAYYPNLGSTCSLPANTSCHYTCAARTTCSAAGLWVDAGNRCPN